MGLPDSDHDCGHVCCDHRNDPHHDHWLDPEECPSCARAEGGEVHQ